MLATNLPCHKQWATEKHTQLVSEHTKYRDKSWHTREVTSLAILGHQQSSLFVVLEAFEKGTPCTVVGVGQVGYQDFETVTAHFWTHYEKTGANRTMTVWGGSGQRGSVRYDPPLRVRICRQRQTRPVLLLPRYLVRHGAAGYVTTRRRDGDLGT